MKLLVALGGNALLERGQKMTAENQKKNIQIAASELSKVITNHNDVVIAHGNGPQVGLLALQAENYTDVPPYPFDVLVAQTEGMIGYILQQELTNELDHHRPVVSLITQVEVDPNDPAFSRPTKPIGQVYSKEEAEKLKTERNWIMVPDGNHFRRAIASPHPKGIVEIEAIKSLISEGSVVICGGGGGIPVAYDKQKRLYGIEAVIDKDRCSSFLAQKLKFDLFIIATDVEGIFLDWGTPNQKRLDKVTVKELESYNFSEGSMGPKVEAAIAFTKATKKRSVIGSLKDIKEIVLGKKGTQIMP